MSALKSKALRKPREVEMESRKDSRGVLQRPDWVDEALYPFKSRFIQLDGSQVHYIDEGKGPTILFLHANATWSFIYRNIIKDLRQDFRCVALDYPGFGLSTAADGFSYSIVDHAKIVEKFVLQLDLSDVTLVAHDSGGTIGMGAAGRHPERFRALVTSNSFAWTLDNYPDILRFLKIVGSGFFGFLNSTFNLLPRSIVALGVGKSKLTAAGKAAYLGPFAKRSSRRAINLLFRSLVNERAYLSEVEAGLEKLKTLPTLNVWGSGDAASKAGFLGHWERVFPNHRTVIVFEGNMTNGHFPQETATDKWIAAFRSWWKDEVA